MKLLLNILFISFALTAFTSQASTIDIAKLNQAFVNANQKAEGAVVNIYTQSQGKSVWRHQHYSPFDSRQFGPPPNQPQRSLGTGFIIDASQGHVVTNAHVVVSDSGKPVDTVRVKVKNTDGYQTLDARILGFDTATDIALLKVNKLNPNQPELTWGKSSEIKVGQWVLAVGNPYGLNHTVTQGIVSALDRSLGGSRAEFIQTSAGINPGNSGGPLINLAGQVIGINSAIHPRGQSLGFAIASDSAQSIVKQLAESGTVERGWMGLGISDKPIFESGKPSVVVNKIFKGTSAEKAGLKIDDVIIAVDGRKTASSAELIQIVEKAKVGQKLSVKINRNGKIKTIVLKLLPYREVPFHS